MRPGTPAILALVALATLGLARPLPAQDREYYIRGTVVDRAGHPVAEAAVELRERVSRQSFRTSTDREGKFKLVGLPRGVYEATVSRPGFRSATAQWDLHEAQETMRKMDLSPVVLTSDAEAAEARRDTTLKELLDEASEKLRQGQVEAALALAEKMLAEKPDDVNALYLGGLCHLQAGRIDAAMTAFERVVALAPGFAGAHVHLGICHDRRGEAERALASYAAALALEPDNPIALYNAGVLRYNAGSAAEALPYFTRLLAARPDDDAALEMAGYCELHAQRYAEALVHLERARALATDPARAATLDDVLKSLRSRATANPAATPGT